jgi:predicted RNase H-like nuclease
LRVFESHPEWNWLRLNGLPVPSKHTSEGLAARLLLLKQRNIVAPSRLATKNAYAKTDDLLDAAVLALSASLSLKTGLQNVSDGSPGLFTFA